MLGMDGQWTQAEEPLHWLVDSPDPVHSGDPKTREQRSAQTHKTRRKGAGLGLPFAEALVQETGVPIGLVICAHGGTSMEQWNPAKKDEGGKSLYGSMMRQFQLAGGKVKGVLWYQGESDAGGEAAKRYPQVFAHFIAAVRSDFGQPELPFYFVQIGRFVRAGDPTGWNAVQEAQRLLPERVPNTAVVSVDRPGAGRRDPRRHPGPEARRPAAGPDRPSASCSARSGRPRRPSIASPGARTTRWSSSSRGSTWSGRAAGRPDSAARARWGRWGWARPATARRPRHGRHVDGTGPALQARANRPSSASSPSGTSPGSRSARRTAREVPLIFEAGVGKARDTVVLKLAGAVPPKAALWYGYGFDPYCNLTDGLDMAVPVFGPIPLDDIVGTETRGGDRAGIRSSHAAGRAARRSPGIRRARQGPDHHRRQRRGPRLEGDHQGPQGPARGGRPDQGRRDGGAVQGPDRREPGQVRRAHPQLQGHGGRLARVAVVGRQQGSLPEGRARRQGAGRLSLRVERLHQAELGGVREGGRRRLADAGLPRPGACLHRQEDRRQAPDLRRAAGAVRSHGRRALPELDADPGQRGPGDGLLRPRQAARHGQGRARHLGEPVRQGAGLRERAGPRHQGHGRPRITRSGCAGASSGRPPATPNDPSRVETRASAEAR